MGFGILLKQIRKLNRINRWSNEYMTEDVRPTVASHTFTVLQTMQILALIEEKNGQTIDWKNLYQKGLNHDAGEIVAGDILSHVKNRNKQMKQLVIQIENELLEEEIYSKLPEEYVDIYKDIFNNGKDETLEGKLLEAADKIDCLVECIIEIQRNNPEEVFFKTYVAYIKKLKKMNLESVNEFLKYTLPELIADCNELNRITKELLPNKL